MRIKNAEFLTSAPELADCPASDLPEFAFIGRSNVGKSSLVNLLCGRKGLAQVSGKPGRTTTINFYGIDEEWTLVDLPGYGYAKTAKKNRNRFGDVIADYLAHRTNLVCVFVLIDSRLTPQTIDLEFLAWLANGEVPFVLAFTKGDKLKAGPRDKNVNTFLEALGEWVEGEIPRVVTSAKTGDGKKDLLRWVERFLEE